MLLYIPCSRDIGAVDKRGEMTAEMVFVQLSVVLPSLSDFRFRIRPMLDRKSIRTTSSLATAKSWSGALEVA